jgi:hypothetical protein
MGHARNHRLRVLAEHSAKTSNEYGDMRKDVSVYELQLVELKNDKSILSNVKSEIERGKAKAVLIPKYMPYVDGIISADQKVNDDIVTTIMTWCFDAGMFDDGLKIANFALKHEMDMPDAFSRDTASVVAEEIANSALVKLKTNEAFDLATLLKAHELTEKSNMHDQIRAKLFCAIGRCYFNAEDWKNAISFMTLAIQHKDNIGCKEELRKAEKLLAKQIEEQPSQIEVDATEADSVASS